MESLNKSELYRFCIKAGNFVDPPTFRIRIGKSQKKINPYFVPSDKQRYNCDSILERKNLEAELIVSCFLGYKFMGSGTLAFSKPEMPNERIQIFNKQHEKIANLDCSLIKIVRVVQVPALEIKIIEGTYDNPQSITNAYLVLKYGELNYQTKPVALESDQFKWDETFKCPESEMERILVESWCTENGTEKFLGVSIIYLRDKDDINCKKQYDISFLNKKRGSLLVSLFEDKQKEAKKKDYSNALKRTIKTTVVEAVMLNPIAKGTFIRLQVGTQQFQTTALYIEEKQLSWNQSFTIQVNSEKQQLTAKLCLKGEIQEEVGRAFLEISKIGNRMYEITLLNEKQKQIGKVYIEFYDHELDIKQEIKRKTIPKHLADKIASDMEAIKNRYKQKQKEPLHQYMQNLNAVIQEGLLQVSKKQTSNPLKELGQFLVNYKPK